MPNASRRPRILLGVSVALLAASACAAPDGSPGASAGASPGLASPTPSPSAGREILVDTDVAPDDVMALAYLAARPGVDIAAVTVSGTGEARCVDGVRVVRSVLERLGRPGIPVACGRASPLVGDHAFPGPWRDAVAAGFRLDLPEPGGPATDLDAVGLLAGAAADAGGALEVLTLGPLTNVADAMLADPTLARRIAGITIMGGAVLTAGNVGDPEGDGTSVNAEWNAYIDPHALAVVLESGVPVTLVPLDATDDVPVTRQLALRIAANRATESARLVYELLARNPDRTAGTSLWDETAALLLADGPEGLTLERHPIEVVEAEGPESGATRIAVDGTEVLVAMAASSDVVTRRFVEGLAGVTAEAPIPEVEATIATTFDGTTCAVEAPATLEPGFVAVSLANEATVNGGVVVVRFSEGVTWDSLVALAAQGPVVAEPEGMVALVSVGADAGETADDIVALDPGAHGIACGWYDDAGLHLVPGRALSIAP